MAPRDRQHPRGLFDTRDLLESEGLGDELRKTFIVYLLSHDRPVSNVLAPARLDTAEEFGRGFEGMANKTVTLVELLKTCEALIGTIVGNMPAAHRRFPMSIKRGEPEWPLLDLPGAEAPPAARWRLENMAKMDRAKRTALVFRLASRRARRLKRLPPFAGSLPAFAD